MDAILQFPPNLPVHDTAPLQAVPARVLASWPEGTFVENLVARADGSVVTAVLSEARLDHVSPHGRIQPLFQFDRPCMGIVETARGDLIVAVGEPGKAPMWIWRVDPSSGKGEPLLEVEGAIFLNGMAALAPGRLLVAESRLGRLYEIDLMKRKSKIWFEDEWLTPSPDADFLPGANGLKVFAHHAYVSSNSRALFFRVPVQGDGSAGPLEQVAARMRVDDFALDQKGLLYLTTHIGHSLDRLDLAGHRVSLAGAAEGLAGSTSCAFGRAPGDLHSLYVTTTGGIVGPVDGVVQPARVVCLDLSLQNPPPEGAPVLLEES